MSEALHVSELAAYEAECRASRTGPDRIVAGWTVADGVVCVNGEPVQSAQGRHIAPRASYAAPCQRCKELKIDRPLALYVRFEHAIDRLMFWHGQAERWQKQQVYCDACEQKMAPRGQPTLGGVA